MPMLKPSISLSVLAAALSSGLSNQLPAGNKDTGRPAGTVAQQPVDQEEEEKMQIMLDARKTMGSELLRP
jgi:hypothetical protein